jgi:hypothetical protein
MACNLRSAEQRGGTRIHTYFPFIDPSLAAYWFGSIRIQDICQ